MDDEKPKPSQRIVNIMDASKERYADQSIDDRTIATILNAIHMIGEILDELEEQINR